jgi:hypothetical protein
MLGGDSLGGRYRAERAFDQHLKGGVSADPEQSRAEGGFPGPQHHTDLDRAHSRRVDLLG